MILINVVDMTRHLKTDTARSETRSDMSSKQGVGDTLDHIKVLMQKDCMWGLTSDRVERDDVSYSLIFLTKLEGSRPFEPCD
jgi:hypothetical protein